MKHKTKAELQAENEALIAACQPLVDLWQQYRESRKDNLVTFARWVDRDDRNAERLELVMDEVEDLLADIDSEIFHVRREQPS